MTQKIQISYRYRKITDQRHLLQFRRGQDIETKAKATMFFLLLTLRSEDSARESIPWIQHVQSSVIFISKLFKVDKKSSVGPQSHA